MMNQNLKQELGKHLKVIKDREKFIGKWCDKKREESEEIGGNK